MAKKVTELPVEINELALSLLGWEVQDFRARVTTEQYKSDGDCSHKLAVSGVFSVQRCGLGRLLQLLEGLSGAPFSRRTPNLMFDILDDTGFMLEQVRGDIDITIHVDQRGQAPSRAPRWLLDLRFDPDDCSAPPSRIIARVEDD